MTSALLLYACFAVIPAQGWSYPMVTVDQWSYMSGQFKSLEVQGGDTLHQAWCDYNNEVRIGYKVYLPDGTILLPETMISNDVWSGYPTGTTTGSECAFAWRQGTPAWYCVRDSIGGEVVPTSFMLPDPYWGRPDVEMASDSLGRIHATFENGTNTCYAVIEPGVVEIWRDTIDVSIKESSSVLVDGNRVHIIYSQDWNEPCYIQYDLEGIIAVPPVSIIDDLADFSPGFSFAMDQHGDVYLLCRLTHGGTGHYLTLFKLDGATGEILISDLEIRGHDYNTFYPVILGDPNEDWMHLIWREVEDGYHVKYARIDLDGNFIEEPYSAYDYSDEEVQYISVIEASINDDGDIFSIWSQGDMELGGYWIVLGWFDHNWVGIEEEQSVPVEDGVLSLLPSANPFHESVTVCVEGFPVPGQLAVYDLSGRIVRTLFRNGANSFFWDGCSSSGEVLPSGSYIIRGASAGTLTSVTVVKL